MESGLKNFINRQTNAVKSEFVLSREAAPNADTIYITHQEIKEPLYIFHQSHKRQSTSDPKHTGGKAPYVMLMLMEMRNLTEVGITNEVLGCVMRLAGHVDWRTGLLKNSGRRSLMTADDIQECWRVGKLKAKWIMGVLRQHELLKYDPKARGYTLSRKILRRGRDDKNADQVQKRNDAGTHSSVPS